MSKTLIFLCTALMAVPALAQLPVEAHPDQLALLPSADPALAANKKLAYDFWREIVVAHHVERADKLMTEDFRQHDPNVPTGRAAFVRLVSASPPAPVKPTIDDLVAIVAEHDLVVLSFRRELPDLRNEGQTYTTTWFEMLRIENGKIAEHWDYGTKE